MPIDRNKRYRRTESILAHPRFAEARLVHIDGYLGVYAGDPALNKLLVEGARHVIITMVLCLDAAQRPDDPDTWLTLGRLQEVTGAHQVGSAGLVEAIVQRMIDRGLLTSEPAPGDRRKRLLRATDALRGHDLDLLAAQARPCAIVAPGPAIDLALARDGAFHRATRIASVAAFADAMEMLAEHPELIAQFIARDSGYMVLLSLLHSASTSSGGNVSTIPYQDIADRFGVSRTHVRDLVAEAEAAELVRLAGQGGTGVEILPRLGSLHDRYLAACMELFDRCCTAGHAMMQERS